jgi:H+/Cl- antiporter ClcA
MGTRKVFLSMNWLTIIRSHRYGATLIVFLAAAGICGAACVYFARGFEFVLHHRLDRHSIGSWCWLATPLGFLAAVEIIRRWAPQAAGTGIPQAVFAAEHLSPATEKPLGSLTSLRTMGVKIVSLFLGIWVGASTGREGPTVHIAMCTFVAVVVLCRRLFKLEIDLRSAVIAGGAAGLAAAFNTPLAGVTFAIEELTENYFSNVKDIVVMAIIVAASIAKAMTGEYGYFGTLQEPAAVSLGATLVISVMCGLCGGFFSTLMLRVSERLAVPRSNVWRWGVPAVMALGLVGVSYASGPSVLGPGNKVAQQLLDGHSGSWIYSFPFLKMAATLLTYWSGIAGGIFAPCLSMGAALGTDLGVLLHDPLAACALLGMAAFLSATIQAPMTAFVIIFEMTGYHPMLLPIMLASLSAFMTVRLLGAKPLYKALAAQYASLLSSHE